MGGLLNPVLAEFVRRYPEIELETDFSDRRVDVIEEGFDAVVRVGETEDSRLMSRQLGTFHLQLVASPDYLRQMGIPHQPAELQGHACLLYKFPSTGKVEPRPSPDGKSCSPRVSTPGWSATPSIPDLHGGKRRASPVCRILP